MRVRAPPHVQPRRPQRHCQPGCLPALPPRGAHALLDASARGATLDQIVAFPGPAGGYAHALLAGVWIDTALRLTDAYACQVTKHYSAEVPPVPFKSEVTSLRLPTAPSPPLCSKFYYRFFENERA